MILPSAIGAMVADLALDPQRTPPDAAAFAPEVCEAVRFSSP